LQVVSPSDIGRAGRLLFPGVGAYGTAMAVLKQRGLVGPLRDYLQAGRPFLGVCLGLQLLFEGSEESGGVEGLGLVPGRVERFPVAASRPVPHIGWSGLAAAPGVPLLQGLEASRFYFVHSYRAAVGGPAAEAGWEAAATDYGGAFLSAVARGGVHAVQFHPEKSGGAGLELLRRFLSGEAGTAAAPRALPAACAAPPLARRLIACLDVRSNDAGDLVVTKGDSYDVRPGGGDVLNLGAPAALARRYADEGADEVAFLNITGYRDSPLADAPMLALLRAASEHIFVPLTVGGGVRALTDGAGVQHSALDVAAAYFRAGADKVSIGSEAVAAAEAMLAAGGSLSGTSAIETISAVYGAQAVVVSVDPRRVYVAAPGDTPHATVRAPRPGPAGEVWCWYQCTVSGGREARDVDVVQLARCAEALGAGELLLNCIDEDGQGNGFDSALVGLVSAAVSIPVIASSGAGAAQHFVDVFNATGCSAALAAGIFHRREVGIDEVKRAMHEASIPTRV
jgi:glutamine amidotransferase/cyclase